MTTVKCDGCGKTHKLSELVVERIHGEFNAPFGDYYAVCPECREGSFDGGCTYMLDEKNLQEFLDLQKDNKNIHEDDNNIHGDVNNERWERVLTGVVILGLLGLISFGIIGVIIGVLIGAILGCIVKPYEEMES